MQFFTPAVTPFVEFRVIYNDDAALDSTADISRIKRFNLINIFMKEATRSLQQHLLQCHSI